LEFFVSAVFGTAILSTLLFVARVTELSYYHFTGQRAEDRRVGFEVDYPLRKPALLAILCWGWLGFEGWH
jgi:hypothetical protein